MMHRRFILERDPPLDVNGAYREISEITGWGITETAFVLNVSRGTLRNWLQRGSRPNVDDGDAIRKLLQSLRGSIAPHSLKQ